MTSSTTEREVVVLAAHPDDETLGCGATLHSLAQSGCRIKLLVFSDGVSARSDASESEKNQRRSALETASQILGIEDIVCGDFPDNQMDTVPMLQLVQFIEDHVSGQTPQRIFTHHASCLNVDHRRVAEATAVAFRPQHGRSHELLTYSIPSSTDYHPAPERPFHGNTYFDVGASWEAKLKALQAYEMEMRPAPHSRSYDHVLRLMQVWGSEVGLAYAEKFELLRQVRSVTL